MSCQRRVGKISVHGLRGGGQVFCVLTSRGGQDFSARKSENSTAHLVAVNNDRSLM